MELFKTQRVDTGVFRPGARRMRANAGADTVPPDDTVELLALGRALWRRKGLVALATLLLGAAFFAVTSLQPRHYTAGATVILDPREQQILGGQDQVVSDLKLSTPILESQMPILRSSSLLQSVVARLGVERFDQFAPAEPSSAPLPSDPARETRIIAQLRDGIDVRRVGDSYVIAISVTTTDPQLSADVANALADSYIDAQLADRRRVAEQATQWLADQVVARRNDLARAEQTVEAYKRDQLAAAGASEAVLQQQLLELNQQIAIARSERATERARLERIEASRDARGAAAAAEALRTPFLDGLRSRRFDLARDEARLAASLGPTHPDRRQLVAEIAQIDAAIAAEVQIIADGHRNELEILNIRDQALQREVDALESQLSDMAATSLQLRELEREADAARAGFEALQSRLGEIRAQVEIQRAEARLVNAAQIPLAPSAPRVTLMTAVGGAFGLTLGLMLALALERLGAGYTQGAALERQTRLPVLATLPRVHLTHPQAVLGLLGKDRFSLLAERIRQLRMTLMLNATEGRPISVVLLSSVPDEGKTTTALALARSFADAGVKAVFVDLDTRRSLAPGTLSTVPRAELGDWVSGAAELDDIVAQTDTTGLSVIGTAQGNALLADAMNAARLRDLVQALNQRFDAVVIDAPPILAVPDGLSIAAAVDQILYVVRHRTTSRRSVRYGLATLQHVGLRPSGFVITKADLDADPDGYALGYTYRDV